MSEDDGLKKVMTDFDEVIAEMERGKEGKNEGLSTGNLRIDHLMAGLQRKTFYLIGAQSSTGKTAFADNCFVLNPYISWLKKKKVGTDIEFEVDYYSFEIDKVRKLAKWAAWIVWERYGIVTDINHILSKGENRVSQEIFDKVIEAKLFVDQMTDFVHIHDRKLNPTGISIDVHDRSMQVGKEKKEILKFDNGKKYEQKTYTANNPSRIHQVIIDHIGKMRGEQGLNKKGLCDLISDKAVDSRNRFGTTWVLQQQFNRDLADVGRQRFTELQPQDNDFKDSGNVYEDCDICWALFNPMKYNINPYMGYDTLKLNKRFLPAFLLKNRDGEANVKTALNFLGQNGHMRYMPLPEKIRGKKELLDALINYKKLKPEQLYIK